MFAVPPCKIGADCCIDDAQLKVDLTTLIQQEAAHAQFHHRFNRRLFDLIPELREVADKMAADLKVQREKRSLAFNAAYCVRFESIATFDSKYLYETCDDLFEGTAPGGANLLLWHTAEEVEHRSVCHNAFRAVSGNYFLRIYPALTAFVHIGGAFLRGESLILEHRRNSPPAKERAQSQRRSKQLLRRHLRYLIPQMLRVFVAGYDPARVHTPAQFQASLDRFGVAGRAAFVRPIDAAR